MPDIKNQVHFPYPGWTLDDFHESSVVARKDYRYDPKTRELRYGDRVIGYADLAGNFQVEPEYEEFVRNNPLPYRGVKQPGAPHLGSAQELRGSLLQYRNTNDFLTDFGGRVPPMDSDTLRSPHASVMIGNRAGLLDISTNKVYDRISMKELGEMDAGGVLQLNQTTNKLPEYAELRGKPVRKQVPPDTNIRLKFYGWSDSEGEPLYGDRPAYWDTETGEIRERKGGGEVYGKLKRSPYRADGLHDRFDLPPDSPYNWAEVSWIAGPNLRGGVEPLGRVEIASGDSIQPVDPTVGKHPGEFDPALIKSGMSSLKPSPPASPDRKGSNAPSKKKSLLTEDYSKE